MEEINQKKDYSMHVKAALEQHKTNVKNKSNITESINEMLILEKKTRLANDLESSKKLASEIITTYINLKEWNKVEELTVLLCRRHAQLKQIVAQIIRIAMNSLELTPDKDTKWRLLKVLREISKGKMHVELEYARMTKIFALMQEERGEKQKACDLLQDVQVETLSAMGFVEKFEFLLDQFRLTLEVNDLINAEISSEKFNLQWLDRQKCDNKTDLKRRFYMILKRYHLSCENHYEVAKTLLKLKNLDGQNQSEENINLVKRAVIYIAIAKGDTSAIDLLRLKIFKFEKFLLIDELADFRYLLKILLKPLLITESTMPNRKILLSDKNILIKENISNEENKILLDNLLSESIRFHNIKVIEHHYSQITLARLSELLWQSEEKVEETLCEMVRQGEIEALINSVEKVVNFEKKLSQEKQLNNWRSALSKTIGKLDRVCHLIEKEAVLHNVDFELQ